MGIKRHILNRFLSVVLVFSMLLTHLSGCAKQPVKDAVDPYVTPVIEIDTDEIVTKAVDEIVSEIVFTEDTSLSTNWEDYQGDLEVFVYGLIIRQLEYKYDVFPAIVELLDGTQINGIAYTDYTECYASEDESTYCFMAGFLPCVGEIEIPREDFDSGLALENLEYTDTSGSFVLAYGSEQFTEHCVVYGKYLKYGVDEKGRIYYSACDYSRDVCDESLGSLYSYDESRFLYDTDFGEYFNVTGLSLYGQINYEDLEAEINRILDNQDHNFVTVDVETCAYVAQEAVSSYLLSLQEETFFGFSVAELNEAVKALDPLECYRMTADGPMVSSLGYDGGAPAFARWLVGTSCGIVTAVSIVGAFVFSECPVLSSLSGAIAGTAIEIFMEVVISGETLDNINWDKVALAATAGAVSGLLGPYIAATCSGFTYFMVDSSLDGLIGGIERAVAAWMDGEDAAQIVKSFGYGFALAFAISGSFKAVSSILGKLVNKIAPSLEKMVEKVFPKLAGKVSKLSSGAAKAIFSMKKVADSSIFHSKYISRKIMEKQLARLIEEGSDELLIKAFMNLGESDIVDKNGERLTKAALKDIFDKAENGSTLAYFKKGDELIDIVKLNGMIGIVFDPAKYQTVTLPGGLVDDRIVNMEEAAEILRKSWIKDPSLIPETLKTAIKNSGIDLEDMLAEDLLAIIQDSRNGWVLHENIDMKTVSLVPRFLHDKAQGGISHMGGYALAKFLKTHMGKEFFERLISAVATGTVIATN